jgi:enoyl-[acyl-carrier protein] reductase III
MKSEFKNKWAIILGGSSGLGLASAKKLASHGMNICIVHRDRKSSMASLEGEMDKLRAMNVEVKTFNKSALVSETRTEVMESLPKHSVMMLLHSIAKGVVKPMHSKEGDSLSAEDISITIEAMATSWYQWSKDLIDGQMFMPRARNLAFTSEGNMKAWKYYGAVSAAKATLEALMRNMALEYAPLGLNTNCIQAGLTKTKSFNMIPGSDRMAEITEQRNPFHRLTRPEDVANVVYLLCKEEANWINGSIIKADGGESNQ